MPSLDVNLVGLFLVVLRIELRSVGWWWLKVNL